MAYKFKFTSLSGHAARIAYMYIYSCMYNDLIITSPYSLQVTPAANVVQGASHQAAVRIHSDGQWRKTTQVAIF